MYSADEQLVSQTLAGDRDAFGVLVHKYQEMVFAYAFQKVRNEADAQDVMQEVFLRAYRNLYALRHPHRFRSWLYTIMSNECNRWLAQAAKTRHQEALLTEVADNDVGVEPAYVVSAEGWREDLERAIAALSDENRVAVSMFYMGDCTLKEISEFLGVSVNTVKTKLHRARRQLGNALAEQYGRLLKSHKLKGGFLMQMMEQIRHMPAPTMGFTWSSPAVGKTVFSLITAIFILVGLFGARVNLQQESIADQIGLSSTSTSRLPIEVALLESTPYMAHSPILDVPEPTGKRPLGISNRTSAEQSGPTIDRGGTYRTTNAKPSNPQFAAAASEKDSDSLAFSGRIVGTDGNPIAGFPIAVGPLFSMDGEIQPFFMFEGLNGRVQISTLQSDTDEEGRFSITGVKPGPIQFMPQPNYMGRGSMQSYDIDHDKLVDAEVVSIDIGVMTFYPSNHERPPFGGITFTIEPGTHLENIEVVVRPRMRIRGQIVFVDGTPLANTEVRTSVRLRDSEDAYLVSINDAAEQEWLVNVFGTAPYWIGLVDSEKEGDWKWMNGDPITYTNWAPDEPANSDHGEEDHVFMGLTPDGKWYNVGPGNPRWQIIHMAIIEKSGASSTPTMSR